MIEYQIPRDMPLCNVIMPSMILKRWLSELYQGFAEYHDEIDDISSLAIESHRFHLEERRDFLLLDWVVRDMTPRELDAIGRPVHAQRLRDLPEITDYRSVHVARRATRLVFNQTSSGSACNAWIAILEYCAPYTVAADASGFAAFVFIAVEIASRSIGKRLAMTLSLEAFRRMCELTP